MQKILVSYWCRQHFKLDLSDFVPKWLFSSLNLLIPRFPISTKSYKRRNMDGFHMHFTHKSYTHFVRKSWKIMHICKSCHTNNKPQKKKLYQLHKYSSTAVLFCKVLAPKKSHGPVPLASVVWVTGHSVTLTTSDMEFFQHKPANFFVKNGKFAKYSLFLSPHFLCVTNKRVITFCTWHLDCKQKVWCKRPASKDTKNNCTNMLHKAEMQNVWFLQICSKIGTNWNVLCPKYKKRPKKKQNMQTKW